MRATTTSCLSVKDLIRLAKNALGEKTPCPFAAYSSFKEQRILNVPIMKPLLIFVLSGTKRLGKENDVTCPAGSFIFLSNNPTIDMRNIPDDEEYFAILIEFDHSDFNQFERKKPASKKHFLGEIDFILERFLYQYIEWSSFAPQEAWHFRKQELLQIIYQLGYEDILAIAEPPSIGQRVYDLINDNLPEDSGVEHLASELAISESTLRRRLQSENTNLQTIRDKVKMGRGLHLVQTTMDPIGLISEKCGYHSPSQFTSRFKQLFGITPTELRKTRMQD